MLTKTSRGRDGGPDVTGLYDPVTGSVQYVVTDPATKCCVLIDPVLDFDAASGRISRSSVDAVLRIVHDHDLEIVWILDTHPHADHLSAADDLHRRTGAPTGIGARVVEMQRLWRDVYNLPGAFDGPQWDRLFADGDTFEVGTLRGRVVAAPGHTLASVSYVIGDAAFIHDTLFMPDSGTARADFPGGDARHLWRSIQAILTLPDETRLFSGHDYHPGEREPAWESTVAEQKRSNIHLEDGIDEDTYVAKREARDRTLPWPKLMLPALQVNLAGGRLPPPEDNGRRYLKIPLDAFLREP